MSPIHTFGPPKIMHTDHRSQLTTFDWTDRLKRVKTRISMDGKARYGDRCLQAGTSSRTVG